jgi:hypothetical protein
MTEIDEKNRPLTFDDIELPEDEEVKLATRDALTLKEQAQALTVTNADEYQAAGRFVQSVRTLADRIKAYWKPKKQSIREAGQQIIDAEKEQLVPVVDADALVTAAMLAWKRRDDARMASERQEAEAKARREEEDKRLSLAQRAEKAGQPEKAEAILNRPSLVILPPAPKPTAAPAGFVVKERWKANVVDILALEEFVGKRPEFANLLLANPVALGQLATSTKGTMHIPGVEFAPEESLARTPGRRP